MPRQKPFSRKTATTYALVHRPQDDPLVHDEAAGDRILYETSRPDNPSSSAAASLAFQSRKVQRRGDLEIEFGHDSNIRTNEGEAFEHGIRYDDTKYDYMQHLRDLGSSDATYVPAKEKGKGPARQLNLEDALRDINLDGGVDDDTNSMASGVSFAPSVASSRYSTTITGGNRTYQDQQDVPDAIAGFQPDMDPRLREVLVALEDEAYVDDEDDIFAALTGEGAEEVDERSFEDIFFDEDDEDAGYESDRTEKPTKVYKEPGDGPPPVEMPPVLDSNIILDSEIPVDSIPTDDALSAPPPTSQVDGDWMASFTKSKNLSSAVNRNNADLVPRMHPLAPSSIAPSNASSFRTGKKRKGALTNPSTFSMTSSSLARTGPLTTLDAQFDRLASAEYMDDIDEDGEAEDDAASIVTATTNRTNVSRVSRASGMSGMSRASAASVWSTASGADEEDRVPKLAPVQFDRMMDEFLDARGPAKGRQRKKAGNASNKIDPKAMRDLDEVRMALGPARVSRVLT